MYIDVCKFFDQSKSLSISLASISKKYGFSPAGKLFPSYDHKNLTSTKSDFLETLSTLAAQGVSPSGPIFNE